MACLISSVVSVGGDGTYTEVLNGIELNRLKAAGKELSDPNLNLLDIGIRVGIIPAGWSVYHYTCVSTHIRVFILSGTYIHPLNHLIFADVKVPDPVKG